MKKEHFESKLRSPYIWEHDFVFNTYITDNKNIIIIIIIILFITAITYYFVSKYYNKIA